MPRRIHGAGETIEDAVRRETREETGIACSRVDYLKSQPWPFPMSLMIGCLAEAMNDDIVIDRNELVDARWFSREKTHAILKDGIPRDHVPAANGDRASSDPRLG